MTRVLVAYASERGGTLELADWVGEALREAGVEPDVRAAGSVTSLDGYDAIVIGGALYTGRWHREARHFVRHHEGELARRPVWLFSSGPLDHSAEEKEIAPVPGVTKFARRVGAKGHITFGGRLQPDARGFIASRIARRSSGDFRDRDRVRTWADGIARELRTVGV